MPDLARQANAELLLVDIPARDHELEQWVPTSRTQSVRRYSLYSIIRSLALKKHILQRCLSLLLGNTIKLLPDFLQCLFLLKGIETFLYMPFDCRGIKTYLRFLRVGLEVMQARIKFQVFRPIPYAKQVIKFYERHVEFNFNGESYE